MKKMVSLLLALLLVTVALPLPAVEAVENTDAPRIPSEDWLWRYYVTDAGGAVIYLTEGARAYYGDAKNLTVPSSIDGFPVVRIGGYAFWRCNTLISVTIPDGVTSIGELAFFDCTSLTSVTIPDSVTTIDAAAFPRDASISIYGYAGSYAETYANANSIPFQELPPAQLSNNRLWSYRRDANDNAVIWAPGGLRAYFGNASDLTVPTELDGHTVVGIGAYAFRWCGTLTNVTIPDGVTSIGEHAFEGCTSLTSVTIPDSVTTIAATAFPGDISINGDAGSYAETYALSRSIPFNDLPPVTEGRLVVQINADGLSDTDSLWSVTDGRTPANSYGNAQAIPFAQNGAIAQEDTLTLTLNVPDGYGCDGTITNAGVISNVNDGDHSYTITANGLLVINLHFYSRQDYVTLYFRNTNNAAHYSRKYPKSDGATFTFPENTFVNSHGLFNCWNTAADGTGAQTYQPNETVALPAADTTYYAIWHDAYFLSFNKNNGTGSMPKIGVLANAPWTEQSIRLPVCAFAKNGYAFTGWNTKANGSGTAYRQQTMIHINEDITLYAQWTRAYTVFLHKDANDDHPVRQEIPRGEGALLMENPFVRLGYVLAGWNTAADGTGTAYGDREGITPEGTMHLYAQWAPDVYALTLADGATVTLDRDNGFIRGLPSGAVMQDLVNQLENNVQRLRVYDYTGNRLVVADTLGTGTVVRLVDYYDGSVILEEMTVVISGDVTGDGSVTADDYAASKDAALGEPTYPAAAPCYAAANDLNGDGMIDVLDCTLIRRAQSDK